MYFIGNFQHVSDQQASDENDRRHGNFSMMVEAETINQALDKFRDRLTEFKAATSFFDGDCTIYISQLLEFDAFPKDEAVIMNINSFAGDPIMPFIACVVPTEQSNSCTIHNWEKNQPTTEGQRDSVFMQFK